MKNYKIVDFNNKGRGLSAEGLSFPQTFIGDEIEGEVENKRKMRGRLLNFITKSPIRCKASCKHVGRCGGCAWQEIKYEEQLKLKEGKVKKLFGDSLPIIPSPEIFFYRNRMDFSFGPDFSVGLKDRDNRVVDIEKCWLLSEESNSLTKIIKQFVLDKKLESYKDGIMRHVVIREGINTKNKVVNILTSDKGIFPLEELWKRISDIADGVVWSINLSPADRSYGDIQSFLGRDFLLEKLNGLEFKVPIQSFFQTNTKQAEKLIKIVEEFMELDGSERVIDLYSGTGSIGLSLAHMAKEVLGIEENEPAVALSCENAKLNNISNFSAISGRVEDVIKSQTLSSDKMVLDPPRPGIHKKVLAKIIEAKPKRIVYVSCNPESQKHDVEILIAGGYKIKKIQPLDMFPHTPHIENIIQLDY